MMQRFIDWLLSAREPIYMDGKPTRLDALRMLLAKDDRQT